MLNTFKNMFKVPELRKKLIFTLLVILVYRVGSHIPTPGIDPVKLTGMINSGGDNGLLGMFDMFVGGAFKRAAVFSLGIMPYISASIIIQLLGTVSPYFHKLQKEGPEGRRKITQYTRYGTVAIALVQAVALSQSFGANLVLDTVPLWAFKVITIVSFTTGTLVVMWLGEQITHRGIGNGISLLILIGIVAGLPGAVYRQVMATMNSTGGNSPLSSIMLLGIILGMVAFIVWMYIATRRIPIQTPKKSVGGRATQGQASVLPLRLNMAGVIPVIFASSLMMVPGVVANLMGNEGFWQTVGTVFNPQRMHWAYLSSFALLIIFFTYFYTSIIFNPNDIADNLKRSNGFIPGIKPGKPTADYLEKVLNYITLPGSVFLAIIAVAPMIIVKRFDATFYFGGTSVLIVVGVALDTLQQIESHLQSRNYSGFMKKGTLKGRIR